MGSSSFDYSTWANARRRAAANSSTIRPITDPFAAPAANARAFTGANEYANVYDTYDAAAQERQRQAAIAQQQAAIAQYNGSTISSTNPYPTMTAAATSSTPTGPTYGGGSSTRTTPGAGDVMDGFARRYLPDQVDNIMQNPTIIAQDLLGSVGKSQLVGDASRYAQAAPALYNLLVGGNMKAGVQDNDDIINYVAKLMGDMSTVGGATPNVQQLITQLYAGLNDKNSSISAGLYDTSGNPTDTSSQVDYINKMIPLLGVFSNYNYSNAMQKQAARIGQEYMAAKAKGGMSNVSYAQYLQDQFLR